MECLERLVTPPLQSLEKTISENEDVFRGRCISESPPIGLASEQPRLSQPPSQPQQPIRGVLKNSGMLPPVVPPFKSPGKLKDSGSSPRRTKKFHRSKTIEHSDLNGHAQVCIIPVTKLCPTMKRYSLFKLLGSFEI